MIDFFATDNSWDYFQFIFLRNYEPHFPVYSLRHIVNGGYCLRHIVIGECSLRHIVIGANCLRHIVIGAYSLRHIVIGASVYATL